MCPLIMFYYNQMLVVTINENVLFFYEIVTVLDSFIKCEHMSMVAMIFAVEW